MTDKQPVIVGTRKSPLALWQTESVVSALKQFFPQTEFEVRTIRTTGDRVKDWSGLAGQVGVFVKEIEDALIAGRIDMAVHSLKDMPCDLPRKLTLGAIGERVDPRDAYLARDHVKFHDLKPGARIGSSSIRRRAQISRRRKDLEFCQTRGNVDTRIKKLASGEVDAIVLAAAGVMRLGLEAAITEYLPLEMMLPAPCQGAIAVEQREDDRRMRAILEKIDHGPTRSCVAAERSFLKHLGSPCRVPIGAMATLENGRLTLEGEVLTPSGDKALRKIVSGPEGEAEALGGQLAQELLNIGGDWIRQVIAACGEDLK